MKKIIVATRVDEALYRRLKQVAEEQDRSVAYLAREGPGAPCKAYSGPIGVEGDAPPASTKTERGPVGLVVA